jgi:hypothetical protein
MSPRTIRLSRFAFCLAMALLAAEFTGPQALADPLYTITDLGTGPITFSTASGGTVGLPSTWSATASATTQFVSVSNGQDSYSFSTTPDTVLGQSTLYNLPSSTTLTQLAGLMNSNGTAVLSGLNTDASNPDLSNNVAYSLQQTSSGSWSQQAPITSGPEMVDTPGNYIRIVGLNEQNQALFVTGYPTQNYTPMLYSINSQTLINMFTFPVLSNSSFFNFYPIAIDDQGRILLHAQENGPDSILNTTLLLTPDVVSSDPLPLSTPEPATMLSWGLICGIVAVVRFRPWRS